MDNNAFEEKEKQSEAFKPRMLEAPKKEKLTIMVGDKKLNLVTNNIFAIVNQFDSIFLNTHKGFNGFWIQFQEFLNSSKSTYPFLLIGVDKEHHLMSEIEPVVTEALNQLNKRSATKIGMNPIWTRGENSNNYLAQSLMIKACIDWLEKNANSGIMEISLVDINPEKNFITAYREFCEEAES